MKTESPRSMVLKHVLGSHEKFNATLLPHPSTHLVLPVTVRNPKSSVKTSAMIDSGAQGNFINRKLVEARSIPTIRKQNPQQPLAVDGRKLPPVTRKVVTNLEIGPHKENIAMDVADIGRHPIILGIPWLDRHNPTIDWKTRQLTFNECDHLDPEQEELPVVKGWKSGQPARIPEVNATSISARIASAHQEEKKSFKELVPEEFWDYEDVFSDEKFSEQLPPHRPWDCNIDLDPAKPLPKPTGLYHMSYEEDKELKAWIDEHLGKGFIRPSQSAVASSCFFVGKKDGKKRLVIDYRKLNDATVSDQYPIPLAAELADQLQGKSWFLS